MTDEHIAKIIASYQFRNQETRYSRRVEMDDIEKNDFNLNISRYIEAVPGGRNQYRGLRGGGIKKSRRSVFALPARN